MIKPGGYIFIIAPHKDRTNDRERQVTPVAELLDRASGKIGIANYAGPIAAGTPSESSATAPLNTLQPQILVTDKAHTTLKEGWAYYSSDDHHHWSVWRTADFLELIKALGFTVVESHDSDDKVGNGFLVVIQKR